jgi:RHH-type proline utilization regulon transcriptional repressor/proline dehydrogenase/delta 1-pyrroline-5-carboxylate dehydrogenase
VQHLVDGIHAGNIYVNRNQIGAVVGSSPSAAKACRAPDPRPAGRTI